MVALGSLALALAAFQTCMIVRNLRLYQAPEASSYAPPPMSVLIPARNEEGNLPGLLASLRGQLGVEFEVLVLDDNSTDDTLSIARAAAAGDSRFRALSAPSLPAGWVGKQHACHVLSTHAAHSQWLFLDADVVLTDQHALARISAHLERGEAAMQSSIPRQITVTWAEQLVIPLIHLVLLGFLPFWEMRRNRMPALGAACGQMVAVKAADYRAVGGHAAVRHRLHDATALAALFRQEGYGTDLFDSTALARCRMYTTATDVFEGFSKNATEGMARPLALPLWTFLLLGANLLPWIALCLQPGSQLAGAAVLCNLLASLLLMVRYRQSALAALGRPLGVSLFVLLQWMALLGKWVGRTATWKGRSYARAHG